MRRARRWAPRLALALLALGVLFGARAGRSQAPGPVVLRASRDASTLETLRAALGRATTAIAADGVGRTLRVESRWPPRSPRAAALTEELRAAVAAALSAAGAPAEGEAELTLDLTADDRELRVALTPQEGPASWWRRFFFRPPASRRWRVPLDAELRTFVDARRRASRSSLDVRSMPLPGRGYLAAGAAGARAGEAPLLVLVATDAVELLRFREGRRGPAVGLAARVERPPGPTPGVLARRPFASLLIEGGLIEGGLIEGGPIEGGRVAVQWRDRTPRYRLRWAPLRLEPVTDGDCPDRAHPWPDACGEPVDGRDYFASALLTRRDHPAPHRAPSSFYERWHGWVRRSDGSVGEVEVVVNPRGRLVARTDGRELGLVGHGAALGVGDMDSDGQVEILTSGPGEAVVEDELILLRLQADGGLRRLWSQPVAGRVRVAGAGDLDGDGVPSLFAIAEDGEGARLWVLR